MSDTGLSADVTRLEGELAATTARASETYRKWCRIADALGAAEVRVKELEQQVSGLASALEEIVRRHSRGCGVRFSGREKGWTCLDEQARAFDRPTHYVKEYGDDVRAGNRRCDVCVARAALSAALPLSVVPVEAGTGSE